jgi:hypothetical protein
MSVSICKICKEPIWSFHCLDCLAKDIEKWISPKFLDDFREFHSTFMRHFNNNIDTTFEHCLKCKVERESVVCSFCYINEFLSWIKTKDPEATKKLKKKFIFGFEHRGFDKFFRNTRLMPITEGRCYRVTIGLCDNCGEFTENLTYHDGRWVCEECLEGME